MKIEWTKLVGCASIAAFLAAGCSSDPESNSDAGSSAVQGMIDAADASAAVQFRRFEIVGNPDNMLSRVVEWETAPPTSGTVVAECEGERFGSFDADGPAREHRAFVMGFWEGADCQITVEAKTEAGETASKTGSVEVGVLPDFLPELVVPVRDAERQQEGWTVFNLNNAFDDVPLILAILDGQGRYRWYHQRDVSGSGAATSVTPIDGGFLVGGTHDSGRIWPSIIEWDGDLRWEEKLDMHHDIRPWKEKSVLYLGRAEECDIDRVNGSTAVIRYDRAAREEVWRWELCDHWAPQNPGSDWDHTNAVEPFPSGEALLTSPRTQSAVFKFEIETGELKWRLGKDGDFTRTDGSEPAFLRQHAPEIQPNGNILVFDNGKKNGRSYSRAVEVSYDTDAMTYQTAWVYRPDPDIFAPIWGDADRLDNGNTLVAFGRRDKNKGSVLQEVTSDKEVVWEIRSPDKWGWYRAERIRKPAAGFPLEAEN